jgi:hypothetical protein
MSRVVALILALALTIGGAAWLVFQIFVAEDVSRNLVVAGFIVLAMGAYWLWTDHRPRNPKGGPKGRSSADNLI